MTTTFPNGKKQEVIIQLLPRTFQSDPFGGTGTLEYDRVLVWADAGLKEAFASIPGIILVTQADFATRYVLALDPRYEVEHLKKEIEAIALTYDTLAVRKSFRQAGLDWQPDWFRGGES